MVESRFTVQVYMAFSLLGCMPSCTCTVPHMMDESSWLSWLLKNNLSTDKHGRHLTPMAPHVCMRLRAASFPCWCANGSCTGLIQNSTWAGLGNLWAVPFLAFLRCGWLCLIHSETSLIRVSAKSGMVICQSAMLASVLQFLVPCHCVSGCGTLVFSVCRFLGPLLCTVTRMELKSK